MRCEKYPQGDKALVRITLAGAPNVGKSTVFNALTGMKQHTGNWTGKTVESAKGHFTAHGMRCEVTDIPGTYSLTAHSAEEEVAKHYIEKNRGDVTVVVCDASSPERSLTLALQIMKISERCAVFLNLCDEAEKAGIRIDVSKLENGLGIPVIPGSAKRREGIAELVDKCIELSKADVTPPSFPDETAEKLIARCNAICKSAVDRTGASRKRDEALDKLFAGKATAYPIMALLLASVIWLTVSGANYPTRALQKLSSLAETGLSSFLASIDCPTV